MPSRESNRDLFSRLPRWLQVCLYPVLVVFIAIPTMVALGLLLFVLAPKLMVQGWFEDRAWWKKMRKLGRVVEWSEAERRVSDGSGTLVVEITEKGPSTGWLVDVPRNVLDPEYVAPTWSDLELRGLSVVRDFHMEQMDRWSVEYLAPHLPKARMLPARSRQLCGLSPEAKSRSVLAVYWLQEGLLSSSEM